MSKTVEFSEPIYRGGRWTWDVLQTRHRPQIAYPLLLGYGSKHAAEVNMRNRASVLRQKGYEVIFPQNMEDK